MPWYNADYPPSYKNQPIKLRQKAVEIANELLLHGADEGIAIATGLKRARQYFAADKRREAGKRSKAYLSKTAPRTTLAPNLLSWLSCKAFHSGTD